MCLRVLGRLCGAGSGHEETVEVPVSPEEVIKSQQEQIEDTLAHIRENPKHKE